MRKASTASAPACSGSPRWRDLPGLPQINIPAGTIAGCPAGMSFIGWPGGDEALLDLACRLSRYCGVVVE